MYEASFLHKPEEEKLIAGGPGSENVRGEKESLTYEFADKSGRLWVRKERHLQEYPRSLNHLLEANNLEERVKHLKLIYAILKTALGDYMVETNFLITKSPKDSQPHIQIIQEKISGKTLADFLEERFREDEVVQNVLKQLSEMKELLRKSGREDGRWKEFGLNEVDGGILWGDIYDETVNASPGAERNIIVTDDGKLKLIDF